MGVSLSRRVLPSGQSDTQVKFFELLLLDRSGCIHEQILTSLGLGERNHVAKAVEPGQQHGESVVAVGKAPMGRSARIEGIQQEAETGLGVLL